MARDDFHLVILGGSSHHPGGVEAFCDRSAMALRSLGGWKITRLPTDTAYLRLTKIRRLARGIASLVHIRRRRPDCVWLQYGNLPDLAYLVVAKLLGLRVMVTPHLGANWRSQSNGMLRGTSRLLLKWADRLALISHTQEQEIALHPATPRSLIRNFLPEEVLNGPLAPADDAPPAIQLIHSGRLSKGKGTFLVVEVCARLRDAGVPFHARITGGTDATTFAQLDALIAKHDLGDRIEVMGRISEDELLDRLRGSDLLVHLSRIDAYPLIVLEAMSCGALAVVMELAGARDQVETYGGHVVSQEAAVEETVAWLAAQDLATLRAQGRDAARRVRANYSWDVCGAALDRALRACIAGDRAAVTRFDTVA